MSKITLSSNASGTGTLTIASPNTSTDRTLTLPDATGTVLTTATAGVPIGGPALSAYQSVSQTLGGAAKIQFQTEEFDTASCYNNTGSTVGGIPAYAFLPLVAGYYQVSASLSENTTLCGVQLFLYKNGSAYKNLYNVTDTVVNGAQGSALVYLNGSTDYIEIYGAFNVSQSTQAQAVSTYFQAAMVRSAT